MTLILGYWQALVNLGDFLVSNFKQVTANKICVSYVYCMSLLNFSLFLYFYASAGTDWQAEAYCSQSVRSFVRPSVRPSVRLLPNL